MEFKKKIFYRVRKYKTFLTAENSFPPQQRRYNDRREEFLYFFSMIFLSLLVTLHGNIYAQGNSAPNAPQLKHIGQATVDPKIICGDGKCEGMEDLNNCPADCRVVAPLCGDGVCEAGEDPQNCAEDCGSVGGCGNRICDSGEDADTCSQDCRNYQPGQLIIRFKGESTVLNREDVLAASEDQGSQTMSNLASQGSSNIAQTTKSANINSLNAKYGVDIVNVAVENIPDIEAIKAAYPDRVAGAPQDYDFPRLEDIYVFDFADKNLDMEKVAEEYSRADPNVEYAEPNYVFYATVSPVIPNEYRDRRDLANQQWALDKVDAPNGWSIERGNPHITIAIVDTGIDYLHPDLQDNIWINRDEFPMEFDDNQDGILSIMELVNHGLEDINGNGIDLGDLLNASKFKDNIDNDKNGYIDDFIGWDFVSVRVGLYPGEEGGPPDSNPMDFGGHGTGVAGVAGAVTNNQRGIAGMCWNCKVMAVRAGYKNSKGIEELTAQDIAQAIIYATKNGANIINMSFGGYSDSGLIRNAISTAYGIGSILVAAAGNDNTGSLHFPAGYKEVVAVAATDQSDGKASFSNHGSWVDLVAPGIDIKQTQIGGSYQYRSGTSFSTPLVSGLLGLMLSKNYVANDKYTNEQIVGMIRGTADPAIFTFYSLGAGRINTNKALSFNSNIYIDISSPLDNDVIHRSLDVMGNAYGSHLKEYILEYATQKDPTLWHEINRSSQPVPNNILAHWNTEALNEGWYFLRLRGVSTTGEELSLRKVLYIINNLNIFPIGRIYFSEVNVDDLDNNGTKEIVVGTSLQEANFFYVMDHKGNSLNGWPMKITATQNAAIGDLDGNGSKEIVVPSGKTVYAWQYDDKDKDGQADTVAGWPAIAGDLISTPMVLSDLNEDGDLEIIAGSWDQNVYVWHHEDGNRDNKIDLFEGWPKFVGATPIAISVDDLNHDGIKEIVVATTRQIFVWSSNGVPYGKWPQSVGYAYGLVIGNVDRLGNKEIAAVQYDGNVYLWRDDGTLFSSKWPVMTSWKFGEAIALADIDENGDLEILATSLAGNNNEARTFIWNHDGTIYPHWPKSSGASNRGPLVADIDGDNKLEVVGFSYNINLIYAWNIDGTFVESWPKATKWQENMDTAALVDLDGDGYLELVFPTGREGIHVINLRQPYREEKMPWVMALHDPYHSGSFETIVFPNLKIEQPEEEAVLINNTVDIRVQANDPQGIGNVRWCRIRGEGQCVEFTNILNYDRANNRYIGSWDLSREDPGGYQFCVEARGKALLVQKRCHRVTIDPMGIAISDLSVQNITSEKATVVWSTNKAADSTVIFGIDTHYGGELKDSNLKTYHEISLSGLNPQVTYHFRVKSKSGDGRETISKDNTFTTDVGGCREISVSITADDTYDLYINGKYIGSDNDRTWTTAKTYPPVDLISGRNVVAVKGIDFGLDGGLLVDMNACGERIVSDKNWRYSLSAPLGWALTNFDDNNWPLASRYGQYQELYPPWCNSIQPERCIINGFPTPSQAYWIWSPNKYDDSIVYFRLVYSNKTIDTFPPNIFNIGINETAINWTTDEPADSQVEYGLTTGYGSTTPLDGNLVTSHSVTLSGLTPNTLYHYRAKSKDTAGNLAVSGDNTFTTPNHPPVARDDTASVMENSYTDIDVLANDSDAEGDSLVVDGVSQPQNGQADINTQNGSVTYVSNTGFVGVDTFTYRARDPQGAVSNEARVTVTVIGGNRAPVAPANLTATAVSFDQISLTFRDTSDNEEGFKIERSLDDGAIAVEWIELPQRLEANEEKKNPIVSFTDTALSPNTYYWYRVRAYNTVGDSDTSNELYISTLPMPNNESRACGGPGGNCYDDPRDYSLTVDVNGNQGGLYAGDGTKASCSGRGECVDDGECFRQGTLRVLTGNVKGFCYDGTWLDCDGSDAAWGGGLGGTYCGNAKAKAGGTGVGEYEDRASVEFCGDDFNEVYVNNDCCDFLTMSEGICCSGDQPYYSTAVGGCVDICLCQ